MALDDWFGQWLEEHLRRHPFAGLPDIRSEDGLAIYPLWRRGFSLRGVHDYATATDASQRLALEHIKFPRDHLPRLLEIAVEILRNSAAAGLWDADTSTREGAKEASRRCPHCQGQGMASVRWWNPRPGIAEGTCAAYCVCPLGGWLRQNHEQTARDVARRMPLLRDVLNGRYPQFEACEIDERVEF